MFLEYIFLFFTNSLYKVRTKSQKDHLKFKTEQTRNAEHKKIKT